MRKAYWIYGGLTGMLLLFLQMMHYKVMIHDLRIELFGVLIALIFLVMGIWVGTQIFKKQQQARILKHQAGEFQLSAREQEVLAHLVAGCSNQEIADRLYISLNTAKTHITSIYQKLGVSRRTQAVQKAREIGIISALEHSDDQNHPKV